MTKVLPLLAIAAATASAALGPPTAWAAGSSTGSGEVAVTSYQQVVNHAYLEEFYGVHLTGTWSLPGNTYVADLQSPGIEVVSADLSSGSVEPFSASGTGDSGSFSLSCPGIGPATFVPTTFGASISVSFTTACSIERNGGASHALTFSATIALPPQGIFGVNPPTGGTYKS